MLILQKDQQNQIPPLSPDTFLNSKILSTDSLCECKESGETTALGNSCVSTQEVLPTCSFAKGFNPNLEADSQNQSSITKPLNDTVISAPLSHKALAMLNVRLLIGRKYTKAISLEKLTMSNHSNNLEVSLQRSHCAYSVWRGLQWQLSFSSTPGSTHE